jgi:hypothetical protein
MAIFSCSTDSVMASTSTPASSTRVMAMPPQPQPISTTCWPGSQQSLAAMWRFLASWASSRVMSGRSK